MKEKGARLYLYANVSLKKWIERQSKKSGLNSNQFIMSILDYTSRAYPDSRGGWDVKPNKPGTAVRIFLYVPPQLRDWVLARSIASNVSYNKFLVSLLTAVKERNPDLTAHRTVSDADL